MKCVKIRIPVRETKNINGTRKKGYFFLLLRITACRDLKNFTFHSRDCTIHQVSDKATGQEAKKQKKMAKGMNYSLMVVFFLGFGAGKEKALFIFIKGKYPEMLWEGLSAGCPAGNFPPCVVPIDSNL